MPVEASNRSIRRWTAPGGINPLRSTGNKATHKLNGRYLFLLCFYRMVYPKCNIREMSRFLFEAHMNAYAVSLMRNHFNIQLHQPGFVFTKSDIIRAEQ